MTYFVFVQGIFESNEGHDIALNSNLRQITEVARSGSRTPDCMERRFNLYSIIWRYIFKWFKDIIKWIKDIFKWIIDIFKWIKILS